MATGGYAAIEEELDGDEESKNRYTAGVEGEMTGRRNTKQCVEELEGDSWSGLKAAACAQCTVQ